MLKQSYKKSFAHIPDLEVSDDALQLGIYATDASLYQLRPLAVLIPRSEEALIAAVKICFQNKWPILPRGSATSLAGQTVNEAVIVDFTVHFNKIVAVDFDQRIAHVQPGVVRDQLNEYLKPHGLHFAPDPATSSRATLGGMIANNSSGTKSIKYGKTIDHIVGLRILLANGDIITCMPESENTWETVSQQTDRKGDIYRRFKSLIINNYQAIQGAYPTVMRRVTGYALDEFLETEDWNLAKIFCGSEGTLGIILEAWVNLEPIPVHKAAFTVHYQSRLDAIREVSRFVDFKPAAVEMLDYNVFQQSAKHPLTKSWHHALIQGHPQATLTVEFFCQSDDELKASVASFLEFLQSNSKAYAFPLLDTPEQLEMAWSLRKNGLGLIMGDPQGRKPIPFIEDMAIPLEHLADYIQEVLNLCDHYQVKTILYAHASVGVLHVRPELDMMDDADIQIMKKISDAVFDLVKKYKGAWSGEHGDGRNRGHRIKDYFGPEVYACFIQLKEIFDPQYLLNPSIIIDVPPMDNHMRYGGAYKDTAYEFKYKYRQDHSFNAIVHQCSGVGACRNHHGGVMCPSFRATSQESDSTRGRANALRLAMSRQYEFDSLTDPKVLDILDLCLSCKACKSECPSNVDMAKLKSEVLQLSYEQRGIPLSVHILRWNSVLSKWIAGPLAPVINAFNTSTIGRWIIEQIVAIDRRRILPLYSSQSLAQWFIQKHRGHTLKANKKVALFADTYINYHDVHIGQKVIDFLSKCGYMVELLDVGCCQRPAISNGLLRYGKQNGQALFKKLKPILDDKTPILVIEPSCTSALLDDIPDLLDSDAESTLMKSGVLSLDAFIAQEIRAGSLEVPFSGHGKHITVHGHCHQKAGHGMSDVQFILDYTTHLTYTILDSGCCGMAGAFGYDVQHYDISHKIAVNSLQDGLSKMPEGSVLIADGFSCRHQIKDFFGKTAKHWVEVIDVHAY